MQDCRISADAEWREKYARLKESAASEASEWEVKLRVRMDEHSIEIRRMEERIRAMKEEVIQLTREKDINGSELSRLREKLGIAE